jgi:hypothetical protein
LRDGALIKSGETGRGEAGSEIGLQRDEVAGFGISDEEFAIREGGKAEHVGAEVALIGGDGVGLGVDGGEIVIENVVGDFLVIDGHDEGDLWRRGKVGIDVVGDVLRGCFVAGALSRGRMVLPLLVWRKTVWSEEPSGAAMMARGKIPWRAMVSSLRYVTGSKTSMVLSREQVTNALPSAKATSAGSSPVGMVARVTR